MCGSRTVDVVGVVVRGACERFAGEPFGVLFEAHQWSTFEGLNVFVFVGSAFLSTTVI